MPDAQITALEQWVAMGAPWPVENAPTTPSAGDLAKSHWAYQPIARPTPPGDGHPIDAFIQAKLREAGLTQNPPADPRTLVRRVAFILTGLPPSYAEVETFANSDKSNATYLAYVEKLLASPHYGERWARHWMDIARYADSKGYIGVGVNRDYPFAYTYRDWLIRAFNDDVSYDRFLQLQLAADQMVGSNDHNLAAMGFLTVGRRFIGNIHDIIDDRIDTLTRGTMGLTVACARCHDHKFDPVTQRDYYALYGVFNSSEEPDELPKIGELEDPAEAERYRREIAKRQATLDEFVASRARHYSLLASLSTAVPLALETADRDALKPLFTGKDRERSRELRGEIDKANATLPSPPRAMVLRDKPQPTEPHIFLRGNPGRPGDQVPRAFLAVLSGGKPEPFKKGSGRLELAQAITAPGNPLTARVIVNRVWAYHFGKGLVRTPGDFGVKGEPPTHPELLDWLATWFMDNGWSLKNLHRLILTSATWQQSSELREEAVTKDPENRLLARQNRQRLDFEAMRDSLLACAGQLDRKLGGKTVNITAPPYSKRRTVYANIDRQNLPGLFRVFDFPSPDVSNPQRFVTTVPQQALFMLNSPFVVEQARALVAAPDFRQPDGPSEWQVQQLYERVFARRAEPQEVEAALKFISAEQARTVAPRKETSAWRYGYGFFDETTKRVQFTPLPHFTGSAWQGGAKLPDGKLGWVMLNRDGGHAGNDPQHRAIRRFTAPRDLVVKVRGNVSQPNDGGDGIGAQIVNSRVGVLLDLEIDPKTQHETKLDGVELKAGDTLDFLVSFRANLNSDSFTWPITIRAEDGEWDSRAQFAGPPGAKPAPLGPWEKYAQVLLQTNEFVFVD
jgi:hypothetical protein